MAEIREKSGPGALLLGFLGFVAFEVVAYYLLRYLTSGLGESDQSQYERTTIVSNWVKTMTFVLLHLALVLGAMLAGSNALPRRYRRQLMGWFYVGLVMSFLLVLPLFA